MLNGFNGIELEQTRLRPISQQKSSKAMKTKTVSYEGKESLEENHWFSSKSCSLVTFCHDRQKVTMPRNCSTHLGGAKRYVQGHVETFAVGESPVPTRVAETGKCRCREIAVPIRRCKAVRSRTCRDIRRWRIACPYKGSGNRTGGGHPFSGAERFMPA